jgi:hypothetical protein
LRVLQENREKSLFTGKYRDKKASLELIVLKTPLYEIGPSCVHAGDPDPFASWIRIQMVK